MEERTFDHERLDVYRLPIDYDDANCCGKKHLTWIVSMLTRWN